MDESMDVLGSGRDKDKGQGGRDRRRFDDHVSDDDDNDDDNDDEDDGGQKTERGFEVFVETRVDAGSETDVWKEGAHEYAQEDWLFNERVPKGFAQIRQL